MLSKPLPKKANLEGGFAGLERYLKGEGKVQDILYSERVFDGDLVAFEMAMVGGAEGLGTASPLIEDPAFHYVLAWSPQESPSLPQVRDCVETTLFACDFPKDAQWMGVIHADAMHPHCHVLANRVDPITRRPVDVFRSWKKMRMACDELERKYGWTHTPDEVDRTLFSDQALACLRLFEEGERRQSHVNPRARNSLTWNNRISFQQWVGMEVSDQLYQASKGDDWSWDTAHRILAEYNIDYKKWGKGASLVDRDNDRFRAKASHVGAFFGLGNMEATLGEFRPPTPGYDLGIEPQSYERLVLRGPERALDDSHFLYRQYQTEMKARAEESRRIRSERWGDQRRSEAERRQEIQRSFKEAATGIRRQLLPRDVKSTLLSVVNMEEKARLDSLKSDIKIERAKLREEIARSIPRTLRYRSWLTHEARSGNRDAQELLQDIRDEQKQQKLYMVGIGREASSRVVEAPSMDIGRATGVRLSAIEREVDSQRGLDSSDHGGERVAADTPVVSHSRDVDAPGYVADIGDPYEVAQRLREERISRLRDGISRYCRATGADNYAVDVALPSGEQLFIGGSTVADGWSPEGLESRVAEIDDLSMRGARISLAPADGRVRHILVDGMDEGSYRRLVSTGYHPAYVQRYAPDRYQAVIQIEAQEGDDIAISELEADLLEAFGGRSPAYGVMLCPGISEAGLFVETVDDLGGTSTMVRNLLDRKIRELGLAMRDSIALADLRDSEVPAWVRQAASRGSDEYEMERSAEERILAEQAERLGLPIDEITLEGGQKAQGAILAVEDAGNGREAFVILRDKGEAQAVRIPIEQMEGYRRIMGRWVEMEMRGEHLTMRSRRGDITRGYVEE